MKQLTNILCVVRAGDTCEPTLQRARALAQLHSARLTIAMVLPTVDPAAMMPDALPLLSVSLEEALRRQRSEELEALTAHIDGVDIQHVVLAGTGFLEIIRQVLREGHDLLIKTAQAPGFINRLFGSEDMHLLRKCPCPVMVLKAGAARHTTRILAAVDLDQRRPAQPEGSLNQQILGHAVALAIAEQAELHVVHAWEAPAEGLVRSWGENPETDTIRYVEGERARHQHWLDQQRAALEQYPGITTLPLREFHLARGLASDAVPRLAARLQADLIVMGTVGRTGIAGLFIGNTAEAILEQMDCSVLAIKPEVFVSPVALND